MWKKLLLTIVVTLSLYAHADAQNNFLHGFDDIPNNPNIQLYTDSLVEFDAAQGRVTIIFARSSLSLEDLLQFYKLNLPTLGWEWQSGDNYFTRSSDTFSIETIDNSNNEFIKLKLVTN